MNSESCSILEIVELNSRCIENLQACLHGKRGLSYVSMMKSCHGNSRYQAISCCYEVLMSFPFLLWNWHNRYQSSIISKIRSHLLSGLWTCNLTGSRSQWLCPWKWPVQIWTKFRCLLSNVITLFSDKKMLTLRGKTITIVRHLHGFTQLT